MNETGLLSTHAYAYTMGKKMFTILRWNVHVYLPSGSRCVRATKALIRQSKCAGSSELLLLV